jgi:hypothetical protein
MAITLTQKYLVQNLEEGVSQDKYERYLNSTTNGREFVIPGKGKEFTYATQHKVSDFNANDFGGGVRTDRADLEDYIMTDTVDLPAITKPNCGIVTITFDESE